MAGRENENEIIKGIVLSGIGSVKYGFLFVDESTLI